MKTVFRAPLLATALLVPAAAWAQQGGAPATPPATTPTAAPAAAAPAGKAFSQQDLDTILAPIALYPDPLLAQIFMSSTYPLQVVEAARWSKANPTVKDKALEDAMQKQEWDPAVKSLTAVPQVLQQMNDKLDWTQKLGDAFLADQKAVMTTVQMLRKKAQDAGNLKTTEQQKVTTETQAGATIIKVESPKPDVVYVPTYNPMTVYGSWWYPAYPPYYMYPPGYAYAPGLAFATGVVVGAAIWGNCNWGGNDININTNNFNNFNKTNISNNKFEHNAANRKGVPYKDQGTAQKYNRGGDAKAAQSREQFRGRAEQGRSEMGSVDKSQFQGQSRTGDRAGAGAGAGDMGSRGSASAGSRDVGGGSRPSASSSSSSRGSGGGFSGGGGGASTRAASSRGSASRGGGGGGRGGGGRR